MKCKFHPVQFLNFISIVILGIGLIFGGINHRSLRKQFNKHISGETVLSLSEWHKQIDSRQIIGEVYILENVYQDLAYKWIKFTQAQIIEKIDGYVKIRIEYEPKWTEGMIFWPEKNIELWPTKEYFITWHKNEDIIWYEDFYKDKKAEIEKRIRKEKEKNK